MHLSELIKHHQFVVTCEIDPPKGVNIEEFLDKVDTVKDYVDAISIGDNQRAEMRAAPLAICHLLRERSIEVLMENAGTYTYKFVFTDSGGSDVTVGEPVSERTFTVNPPAP